VLDLVRQMTIKQLVASCVVSHLPVCFTVVEEVGADSSSRQSVFLPHHRLKVDDDYIIERPT
jgi:hypothetical protein